MAIELEDAVALARAVKEGVMEELRAQGLFDQKADKEAILKSQAQSQEERSKALEAARGVLVGTLSRLLAKEAKAAEKIANGNINIDRYLDEFYRKHEALAEKELGPALAVLTALGKERFAASEARELCAASKKELRDAYSTDSKAQLKARLESWPSSRAEREAKRIMGEAE